MNTAKFTKLERRVGDVASRRARRQLMRVPWDRFHKAYEEYIRWQAFVLWARAIVEFEGSVPSWLKAILRKRCPGFTEEVDRLDKPELLGLLLLPWVHNHAFGFAKQEGWLDALVFYGFRDTRSQGYWRYWEHCESEWKKQLPAPVPTFVQWRRLALNWKFQGDVSCATVAKAVEKYIDFETFVYWLRPLFQAPTIQLPAHVALELDQESPGLFEIVKTYFPATYRGKSRCWHQLSNWGKDHVLSHAKEEGWLDCVFRQARIHPLHVRMEGYATLWRKSWLANAAVPYPSLRQWRSDARGHVTASQK